jgi:gamma-glutamyltranspeptidase/glutathione hydrolase/leukotriene-C4 hydrolase
MYAGNPDAAVNGGLAIAVPLELKGLWTAHQRHGSMAWEDLIARVVHLARDGFPAHPYLIHIIGDDDWLDRWPDLRAIYKVQRPNGQWRAPALNETCCKRPALADLLQRIAAEGPDAVYGAEAAQRLAADIQAAGGIVTQQDLQQAQATVKQTLTAKVWGFELVTVPPPSSGAAVIAALNILAGYAAPFGGANSLAAHHIVEAMKSAFALRMHLGDPGPNNQFLDLTALVSDMLSPSFADSLRAGLNDSQTNAAQSYGGQYNLLAARTDHGTSHLSVVDVSRGALAMTTTVNTGFGSKVVSKSTGLIFNNQMDDFSTPNQPNAYGLEPSAANFIRPGKKPLSSMSPMIIQDDGGNLVGTLGASGGPLIVTSVLQTLLRLLGLGMDPLEAVSAPRLHHQLLPDIVGAEDWNTSWAVRPAGFHVAQSVLQGLTDRGHNVSSGAYGAIVQAIMVDTAHNVLIGTSDPRKDGAPAGY